MEVNRGQQRDCRQETRANGDQKSPRGRHPVGHPPRPVGPFDARLVEHPRFDRRQGCRFPLAGRRTGQHVDVARAAHAHHSWGASRLLLRRSRQRPSGTRRPKPSSRRPTPRSGTAATGPVSSRRWITSICRRHVPSHRSSPITRPRCTSSAMMPKPELCRMTRIGTEPRSSGGMWCFGIMEMTIAQGRRRKRVRSNSRSRPQAGARLDG
jgi:hypothetical protein